MTKYWAKRPLSLFNPPRRGYRLSEAGARADVERRYPPDSLLPDAIVELVRQRTTGCAVIARFSPARREWSA